MEPSQKPFISLKYIFSAIFRYRAGIILVAIFYTVWAITSLIIPFATKAIIDIGVGNQDLNAAQVIIVSIFILFLIKLVSEVLSLWILRHIGVRVNLVIVLDYFRGILQLSLIHI